MNTTRHAILFSAALLVFALMAGCNLAPTYHRPSVETPAAFKETNGWKIGQPSDGLLKGKWWEMFNDPQLNALEEKVAVSNQNVAAALQNFFAARDIVKEARAAYYPTAGVNPSATYTRNSVALHQATAIVQSPTYWTYSLPGEASWEPDLWGTVRNTVRSDAYTAQADAATLENVKLTAQGDLAVFYFELRSQDELIKLYSNTVRAYRESLDLTTTLFQTGIYSQLNQAQADALLETTLVQAAALEIQRSQYEHAIAVLLGQSPSTFSISSNYERGTLPVIPVGLPSQLLERRPDIATAERAVAAANAQIGVARAAFFPTLSLTGTAGWESTSVANLFSGPSAFWAVGADLSETIFDAGRRRAATAQAWAAYRSTMANYRQTVLTAYQQVEDNLAALRILGSETRQQDIAIRASQKSLDLSVEQYRQGIASYLNVISAQETLLGNQQTAVALRQSQWVDTVQLIMALGGGWTNSQLPAPPKLVLTNSPDGK